MKTTTVRFDVETWDDIVRQSEALGISHAEFIRGAVHRRLGRLADADRLSELEQNMARLAKSVAPVVHAIRAARAARF